MTRTFLKQKDSAVVSKIAGEAGLSPSVDTTTVTYDYILQNNQTNMEFLMARAERIGYQVFVTDGKLCFKKGDASQGVGPELVLGDNLSSFRPCWTATHQADQVSVKGWDPKGKKPIASQAAPSGSLNQGGMQKTGAATAKSAFGGAEAVVVDQPVFTVDEAKALVTGLSNDISREFVEAEGACLGHPGVKAGWQITIKGVGQRFSGKYFVTSATHIYNETGYETTFSITGRHPNTVSHLLESRNGHQAGRGLISGVTIGLVTNINDPDELGRIKVKYPLLGDDIESDWLRIASPMAGNQRGLFYLPEVNDEVLIAFEHGDVHRPYMMGALWNSQDKPPISKADAVGGGKVKQRVVTSTSGHTVILDDTSGSEQIIIRDKTENNEIMIDSAKNSMTITVDGDFTVQAKGKITLKSTQDMTLDAGANGKFTSKANLTVEAQGKGNVKGTGGLALESSGQSTLKGTMVEVNGSASAAVKSSGVLQVQGSLVKIN